MDVLNFRKLSITRLLTGRSITRQVTRTLVNKLDKQFEKKVSVPRIRRGSKQELETLISEEAMLGDKLVFYLKNPVKAIVGIYEVKSSMYVDKRNFLWKNQLYPYRIRIEPIKRVIEVKNLAGTGNLLSLSEIIGKITGLRSLSALQEKSMVAITAAEFRIMNSLLTNRHKSKV